MGHLLNKCLPPYHIRPTVDVVSQFKKVVVVGRRHNSTLVGNQRATETLRRTSRPGEADQGSQSSCLKRLPTSQIMRSLILGTFFTTPILFQPGFSVLRSIANSRSKLLNPDLNPILRFIIKPFIYDQFCAGRDKIEVERTRDTIKSIGYSGVILCYGREIVVPSSNKLNHSGETTISANKEIEQWKNGNLNTLDMVGKGDWLGIKFTGAGPRIVNDLMKGNTPSQAFVHSMDAICHKAKERGCRIWIDAEQQILQTGIDGWTIDLMRKYNTDGHVLVYNTLQAYLKSSRNKLKQQLELASKQNWTLAIKLVRGAYIGNDRRDAIHDTKDETDESYNSIVRDLLGESNLGEFSEGFPKTALFLAGHNPHSFATAMSLVLTLHEQGRLKTVPEFGQLQGMADELGCGILEKCEDLQRKNNSGTSTIVVPRVYKCLTWGSVQECMQYLVRRAVENSGGTDRMRDGLPAMRAELRRRVLGF